ncbi:MAG: hypothetical protein QMD06_04740 [Candidatus Altarchaeum sp.]|nr:hypothetical protein [Candidatus Altarchaeum sp.]
MKSKNIDNLILAGKIVTEDFGVRKDVSKEVIEKIGNEWLSKSFEFLFERAKIKKIFKKTLLREE